MRGCASPSRRRRCASMWNVCARVPSARGRRSALVAPWGGPWRIWFRCHDPTGLRSPPPDDRHDPRARDGRGAEGQCRSSRHGDGARAGRVPPLRRADAPQPGEPAWPDRDRFVLSAGHACILQYAALHLAGYDVTLEDLQQFRQWGSRTPAIRSGVTRRASRRRPGRSARASRTASAWRSPALPRRSLQPAAPRDRRPPHLRDLLRRRPDGGRRLRGGLDRRAPRARLSSSTSTTTTTSRSTARRRLLHDEDKGARFEAYGWHVQHVDDAEDLEALAAALVAGAEETARPSLIVAPQPHRLPGAARGRHGEGARGPLGEPEVRATKEALGFDPDEHFVVPDAVREHMRGRRRARRRCEAEWQARFDAWAGAFPELRARLGARRRREPRDGWRDALPVFPAGEDIATRDAGKKVMQAIKPFTPTMSAAPPTSSSRPRPSSRARASSRRRTPAATSPSASASTRWARSSTASRSTRRC